MAVPASWYFSGHRRPADLRIRIRFYHRRFQRTLPSNSAGPVRPLSCTCVCVYVCVYICDGCISRRDRREIHVLVPRISFTPGRIASPFMSSCAQQIPPFETKAAKLCVVRFIDKYLRARSRRVKDARLHKASSLDVMTRRFEFP